MRMFQALHKYYDDCFSNGEFDTNKVLENGLIDSSYNTDNRLKMLRSVYDCVLKSKSINDITKMYITHSNKTYEDIVNMYNASLKDEEKVEFNSARNRIIFCQNKIKNSFPTIVYGGEELCLITWIFNKKCHMGLELDSDKLELQNYFIDQLNYFNNKYAEPIEVSRKDLLIKIPVVEKVKTLDEEKFNNFVDIIEPYTTNKLNIVQGYVNNMKEEVGYFRYLMSKSSKLSDEDVERKNILLRLMGKDTIDRFEQSEINSDNEEDSEDGLVL